MWLHHNAITNITFHWIWKVCGEVSIQEQTPKNLVFERDWTTWLEFVISTFYLLFLKGGVLPYNKNDNRFDIEKNIHTMFTNHEENAHNSNSKSNHY